MKKFTQITEAKSSKLDIQTNTIDYISADDLKKYLDIAGKCISEDTKKVINWLIVNNDSYLHDLNPNGKDENSLAVFYNSGVPKDEKLKELYKYVGLVVKTGDILQIPVFQTKEQFEAIINKKVAPDEILIGDCWSCTDGSVYNASTAKNHSGAKLTATAEKNRTKLFNKYQPLMYKIVNQWMGKSKLPWEELYAAACEGMVYAINHFGHQNKRDENGKWVETSDDEKNTNLTFGQYLGNQISNHIRGAIENSHLVRISKSYQKKQREEQGFNAKNITVSGNTKVGSDGEGNGKTLFDYIENSEMSGKHLDNEDLMKLWKSAYAKLEQHFSKEDMEFFYRVYRINGYEEEKKNQKELAAEYGLKPSTANVRLSKIIHFILKDKNMLDMFKEILELAHECKQEQWKEEDQLDEGAKISNLNIFADED